MWDVLTFDTNVVTQGTIANIVVGGSALFVFISGFFFHHVFYKDFNYKDFIYKKLIYVYLPFFIITTLLVIIYASTDGQINSRAAKEIFQASSTFEIFKIYLSYLAFGGVTLPYWYVPFIMVIFLLSPIFTNYIKLPLKTRLLTFIALLLISLIIHKPDLTINGSESFNHLIQLTVYYLPLYLLGINCSIDRDKVMAILKGKSLLLASIVILLALIECLYFSDISHYAQGSFSYKDLDIRLIQKIFLIFFFLAFLQRYEDKEIKWLKLIASASFAIYFLHMFVKKAFLMLNITSVLSYLPNSFFSQIFTWVIFTCLVVFITLLISILIKKTLKKNSRYLIGW
jgi:surface polysaccharide O-acyltransferase-like enzyme